MLARDLETLKVAYVKRYVRGRKIRFENKMTKMGRLVHQRNHSI